MSKTIADLQKKRLKKLRRVIYTIIVCITTNTTFAAVQTLGSEDIHLINYNIGVYLVQRLLYAFMTIFVALFLFSRRCKKKEQRERNSFIL